MSLSDGKNSGFFLIANMEKSETYIKEGSNILTEY